MKNSKYLFMSIFAGRRGDRRLFHDLKTGAAGAKHSPDTQEFGLRKSARRGSVAGDRAG